MGTYISDSKDRVETPSMMYDLKEAKCRHVEADAFKRTYDSATLNDVWVRY